jgi:hypothetical protein
VHGYADGAALVGDAPGDRLTDPPGGVGRELVAPAVVELLDRPHEAEIALLDEVEQGDAAADVALGDRHHETQIGLGELAPGFGVVPLDPLGEADLFVGGQQRHLADGAQILAHGIDARRRRGAARRLGRIVRGRRPQGFDRTAEAGGELVPAFAAAADFGLDRLGRLPNAHAHLLAVTPQSKQHDSSRQARDLKLLTSLNRLSTRATHDARRAAK